MSAAFFFFFFSSRRRHTRFDCDWSSDVCSSDLNLAIAVAEWMDAKLNLIDTPGYLDFTGEALAGVWAADGAVVVVSATGGVEVGTEKVWDYAEQRGVPRMFFVSLMDKEHADFEKVYHQIKERLTAKVIPVEIPVGEGPEFHGII